MSLRQGDPGGGRAVCQVGPEQPRPADPGDHRGHLCMPCAQPMPQAWARPFWGMDWGLRVQSEQAPGAGLWDGAEFCWSHPGAEGAWPLAPGPSLLAAPTLAWGGTFRTTRLSPWVWWWQGGMGGQCALGHFAGVCVQSWGPGSPPSANGPPDLTARARDTRDLRGAPIRLPLLGLTQLLENGRWPKPGGGRGAE